MKCEHSSRTKFFNNFSKDWFHYDIKKNSWSHDYPMMESDLSYDIQDRLELDMDSICNVDDINGAEAVIYKMAKHKVDIWLNKDYSLYSDSAIDETKISELNSENEHTFLLDTCKIVIVESVYDEILNVIMGSVDLLFSFSNIEKKYFMMDNIRDIKHIKLQSIEDFKIKIEK